jgi:hypothetical protein
MGRHTTLKEVTAAAQMLVLLHAFHLSNCTLPQTSFQHCKSEEVC